MHDAVTRIRWFLPVFLASALCAQGDVAPQSRALFDETFASKTGAWVSQTAQATNGELVLTCVSDAQYEGVQVVFGPTLKAPPDGEGQLRLQFTVAGVATPNGGHPEHDVLADPGRDGWQHTLYVVGQRGHAPDRARVGQHHRHPRRQAYGPWHLQLHRQGSG